MNQIHVTRGRTRMLAIGLGVADALGFALSGGGIASADTRQVTPDATGSRGRVYEGSSGICFNPGRSPGDVREWEQPDGTVLAGIESQLRSTGGGFVACVQQRRMDAQGLVRFPMPTGDAPVQRAELTFRRLPAEPAVTWPGCADQQLAIGPAVSAWRGGATSGAAIPWAIFLSQTARSGDDRFSVDVTEMVREWQAGIRPNRGFTLTLLEGSAPSAGDYDLRCTQRYTSFALTLVTDSVTPPPPPSDRPMHVDATARFGGVPVPAGIPVMALIGGVVCGTATSTGEAVNNVHVDVRSSVEQAGCGRTAAGDRVLFRIGFRTAIEVLPFQGGRTVSSALTVP